VLPSLKTEFRKYPAVYRSQEGIKAVMPAGMVAMFVGILALAVIYAMLYRGWCGAGGRHALRSTNRDLHDLRFRHPQLREPQHRDKSDIQQSVVYFLEWAVTGMAIGLIYRPM